MADSAARLTVHMVPDQRTLVPGSQATHPAIGLKGIRGALFWSRCAIQNRDRAFPQNSEQCFILHAGGPFRDGVGLPDSAQVSSTLVQGRWLKACQFGTAFPYW